MNKHSRFVYRVTVSEVDPLTFNQRRYLGVDRVFTSRRSAFSLYRNLLKHSDFFGSEPLFSLSSCSSLCRGYLCGETITIFSLTIKKL